MPGVAGSLIVEGKLGRKGLKLLRRTLKSTLQAPYNELILVEHNGDGSVYYFVKEWAREYRVEVDRVETRGPATAAIRALLARFLSGYNHDWLLLVRGFLELRPGWWVEASMHAERRDTGLVWGVVWTRWELDSGCPENPACLERKLRRFECLGSLDDALLRREALKDLEIPGHVRYYVDAWIYWWLRCRGWRVEVAKRGAVALDGWPAEKPSDSIYEAYRLGILEECSTPAREAYRGILKPAASLMLGLVAHVVTRLYTIVLGGGLRDSAINDSPREKWRLVLARLRYGPPRHPCDLVFGSKGKG